MKHKNDTEAQKSTEATLPETASESPVEPIKPADSHAKETDTLTSQKSHGIPKISKNIDGKKINRYAAMVNQSMSNPEISPSSTATNSQATPSGKQYATLPQDESSQAKLKLAASSESQTSKP